MLKKLIVLLPLAWVVAIGAQLAHSAHRTSGAGSLAERARPPILPPRMFVLRSTKKDLMVYADLTGRDLTAVDMGAFNSDNNGPFRPVSVRRRPAVSIGGYTPIIIPARYVDRLATGFYPVHFVMSDGSRAYMTIMVIGRPLPGTQSNAAKPHPQSPADLKVAST